MTEDELLVFILTTKLNKEFDKQWGEEYEHDVLLSHNNFTLLLERANIDHIIWENCRAASIMRSRLLSQWIEFYIDYITVKSPNVLFLQGLRTRTTVLANFFLHLAKIPGLKT